MQAGVRLHVSRRACVKQAVSWRVQYVILFKKAHVGTLLSAHVLKAPDPSAHI